MSLRSVEFSDAFIQEMLETEFCRICGGTVTWSSENWLHDSEPFDEHKPSVPTNPYDEFLAE